MVHTYINWPDGAYFGIDRASYSKGCGLGQKFIHSLFSVWVLYLYKY